MTGRATAPDWRERVAGWVQLAHPGPSLATTFVTAASARAAAAGWAAGAARSRTAWATAAMALAQVSTGSLNDWADAARDALGQPYKPIPRGRVGRPAAAGLAVACALGALATARPLGAPAGRWLGLGLAAGWSYDLGLSGSACSPIPFMVGLAAVPMVGVRAIDPHAPVRRSLLPLALVLALAAHLANGAPDAATDSRHGRRSLPARLGTAASWRAARLGIACAGAGVVTAAPPGRRGRALGWVLGAGAVVALDRLRSDGARRPESTPFVGQVVASLLLASGWLSGGWRASSRPGRGAGPAAIRPPLAPARRRDAAPRRAAG
ncbi:MAG TPA: UbiA family prenyltransferase [Verrucomicrobiae bacterium]|nr:UbiA family prenyltransferase [Verrucomicrobiae bacterium]